MNLNLSPVWITGFSAGMGLLFGSFATVLVSRVPQKKSIIKPASHCPHCKTPIRWFHNIPVLGYLIQQGKCASCKKEISVRYPLIELLTMLLFVTCAQKFGVDLGLFLRDWVFMVLLISIAFIDLEHRIIPDRLSLPGLAWGLLTSPLNDQPGWMQSLIGAALGFGIFYALAWFYQWRTGRSGLGGGDIKFLAMLGAYVGPMGVLQTILISSVLGSVVGIFVGWVSTRGVKNGSLMKTSIPYGPFLAVGALAAYLLGEILWTPYLNPT
ncbi:MAG: prepilin peptidase [Bdellovibrionales bacterium]|nr:prepilin peptidase [Bdellovibrionales bacterium]